MGWNLPLPDERAAIRINVFEWAFERDDIPGTRPVDLFYECGERGRLSGTRRPGNNDQAGRRLDESFKVRVQVAAMEVHNPGCEQPYRGRHSAQGLKEIDPAPHAAYGHRNVGGSPAFEVRPTLGAQEILSGLHQGIARYDPTHRLQFAAHPRNHWSPRFQMQVTCPQR